MAGHALQALSMELRQLMKSPVTIPHDADRETALRRLQESQSGALVITDASGQARGLVTRSDLDDGPGQCSWPAADFAPLQPARPLVSAAQDDSIDRAKDLMIHHGITRLPVLHRGRPVGMVTREDILEVMRQGPAPLLAVQEA